VIGESTDVHAGAFLDALLAAIARFAPAVLGLSVTMPAGPRLPDTLARIREVDPQLPILVGGAGARDARKIDATARFVADAAGAVGAVEMALRAA
jgi:hypothetical protein